MRLMILFLSTIIAFGSEEDANYLNIPISFKPYLETIRWAFERDENGTSTKTLREVKERVDPLKEDFFKLVNNSVIFTYYEMLEPLITRYYVIYRERYLSLKQPLSLREEAVLQEQYEEVKPLMANIPNLSECKTEDEKIEKLVTNHRAIKEAFEAIGPIIKFDPNPTPEKTTLSHLRTLFDLIKDAYSLIRKYGYCSRGVYANSIAYTFEHVPPSLLDEYLFPVCKKAIFPFYMIETFKTFVAAANLKFDYAIEGRFYCGEDGELRDDRIIDVTDKLDDPFFDVYDIILSQCSVFVSCPKARLMDNFCHVFDNFVRFAPFFDFELTDDAPSFKVPLVFQELEFKPKMSPRLFAQEKKKLD
jgi:hypothetical protein